MATAGKPKLSLISIAMGKSRDSLGEEAAEGGGPPKGGYSAAAELAANDLIEAVHEGDPKAVIAALKKCMEYC